MTSAKQLRNVMKIGENRGERSEIIVMQNFVSGIFRASCIVHRASVVLYPIQLKKPIYDEAFLRKNCDGECGLYQVIQPNSPSKFLPKKIGRASCRKECRS